MDNIDPAVRMQQLLAEITALAKERGFPIVICSESVMNDHARAERRRCVALAARKRDVARIKGWDDIAGACDMLILQITGGDDPALLGADEASKAERERCATVAENPASISSFDGYGIAAEIAAAIRALK